MNVGSLFSGIGGLELGFSREGFETKWFIENNEYCQAVLRKNFSNTPIYADIREVDFGKLERVDILTGGFPCQDVSCANPRGEGISGERSGLWSYYAKAIREIRPEYAVIENVPMLANRGLNVVLRDLAENGYDAEWFCLRASDFGALHRRERLFVIAHPVHMGREEYRQLRLREGQQQEYFNGAEIEKDFITHSSSTRMEGDDGCGLQNIEGRGERMGARELERGTSSDTDNARNPTPKCGNEERETDVQEREYPWLKSNGQINTPNIDKQLRNAIYGQQPNDEGGIVTNPDHQRQSQPQGCKQDIRGRDNNGFEMRFITDDWDERIQRFCAESLQGEQGFSWCQDVRRIEDLQGRPDIPQPLFRGGRDGIQNWMDRIKCCGNAVVPQVAQFIARRIKEIEK